jgi:hypothetical protein
VKTGLPGALDADEPRHVGQAVAKLGLKHVVITSVDRDDLADGGAEHFAQTIRAIREHSPGTTVEVLTPDFLRKHGAVEIVAAATLPGSAGSSGNGKPVLTLQKAQARVQVSPMIIMVAWRWVQHSPIFGQAASSQTVCNACSRTMDLVSAYSRLTGAFTRIHSGLRSTIVSGRCAFSGWRSAGRSFERSITVVM